MVCYIHSFRGVPNSLTRWKDIGTREQTFDVCHSGSSMTNRRNLQLQELNVYVLKLEDGCFYVGMTGNVDRRLVQHTNGTAATWTTLHRPLAVLHRIPVGAVDYSLAARFEDEVTISTMSVHGIENVRGGQYCSSDQLVIEDQLRRHQHWTYLKRSELDRQSLGNDKSWDETIENFMAVALKYYDAGSPIEGCHLVFDACHGLTRFPNWREEFAPALSWEFWGGPRGILPILFTMKLHRVVGSKAQCPHDALAAALTRGRGGKHPLRRLFLLAWQAHRPPLSINQAATNRRFMQYLQEDLEFDRQYDGIVAVLFPEMRKLLLDA